MLFHSTPFILGFLPICLTGFFLAGRYGGSTWALRWMVAASLFFYAWWSPAHLPLLIGSVLANHAIACRSRRSPSPGRWLAAGVTLNLLLLGWFKYADFLLHIAAPGAARLSITLPLAISFFTFQQIMFLVDAARASPRQPVPDLLPYAAFLTFFPHLIAGPIVRPAEIMPQLAASRFPMLQADNLTAGLLIFLLGLGKKLVLADLFGGFADTGFDAASHGAALSFFEAWYATLSYALQIYFDFSGYSGIR